MGFKQVGELHPRPDSPTPPNMRFYSGDHRGQMHHHDLALVEMPNLPPPTEWSRFGSAMAMHHIAITWSNREAWLKQLAFLQHKGVTFYRRVNHGMTHSVYISDPNGYGIEVLEVEIVRGNRIHLGIALQLNLHVHLIALEGVLVDRPDKDLKPLLVRVASPSDADIAEVVQAISRQIIRKRRRLGYLEAGIDAAVATSSAPLLDNAPELARSMAASVRQRIVWGARAGKQGRRMGSGCGAEGQSSRQHGGDGDATKPGTPSGHWARLLGRVFDTELAPCPCADVAPCGSWPLCPKHRSYPVACAIFSWPPSPLPLPWPSFAKRWVRATKPTPARVRRRRACRGSVFRPGVAGTSRWQSASLSCFKPAGPRPPPQTLPATPSSPIRSGLS
jgi:catechol 2,3-dioxygenase-like lactoylglutathione lyase family enzyme